MIIRARKSREAVRMRAFASPGRYAAAGLVCDAGLFAVDTHVGIGAERTLGTLPWLVVFAALSPLSRRRGHRYST
jgi:hypothetical protein